MQNLDKIYERKTVASQLALRKRLLSLKLQGVTSMMQHFTVFDDLIAELLTTGAKLEETDKVSHLVLTLPNSYDGVITAIETLSEDNLSLVFVKTLLLDHEVKVTNESRDTSTKALLSDKQPLMAEENRRFKPSPRQISKYQNKFRKLPQNNRFKNKKETNSAKCHHYGRPGHFKRDCFFYKKALEYKQSQRPKTVQTVQVKANENQGFAFMLG